MTKEHFIKACVQLKREGLSIADIYSAVSQLGFKTRYGNPPTKSTIAFWLSNSGEDLPDLRKVRSKKPESHYKQKRSEANRRYRTKNRERLNEYSRNYYQTYIKGS